MSLREVAVNHRPEPHEFCTNFVRTSKYTKLNFLPKNLFEQFRRLSNAWFLVMAAFQMIPDATVSQGVPTIFIPLGIVVASTMLREAVEDLRRHRADNEMNATETEVIKDDGADFEKTAWRDVHVGQIIRVHRDESVAADMVLISTSNPEGIAYIQTSNIDGETNLKFRQALMETNNISSVRDIKTVLCPSKIVCELPNNRVHTFAGSFELPTILCGGASSSATSAPIDTKRSLTIKHLLLRGSRLQNTDWAIGVVVYTGNDTKVRQNSAETPSKRSVVEKRVNTMIGASLVLQFACCILVGVLAAIYNDENKDVWYLDVKGKGLSTGAIGIYAVITSILVLQDVVPIAIFISMDISKTVQSQLINNDVRMYYEEEDCPAVARTSNLNESLGQVQYLFSDKTGTLTCNQMKFKACSVGGVKYGETELEGESAPPHLGRNENAAFGEHVDFYSDAMAAEIRREGDGPINEFLRCLAVCHTIIPEDDPKAPWGIGLKAESPDESALVCFAGAGGYQFCARKGGAMMLRKCSPVFGNGGEGVVEVEENFEVLATIEFTSARKRMSVVVRDSQGRIKLYTKGADSIIVPLLAPSESVAMKTTQSHLDEFGTTGLRTLLVASRIIPQREADEWLAMWNAACNAIDGREEKMETTAALLEQDLSLLGATAIEDRLQDGVPTTIAKLRTAGIRIWMLTGDKLETAVNIAKGCKLVHPSQPPHIILYHEVNDKSEGDVSPIASSSSPLDMKAKLRQDLEAGLALAKQSVAAHSSFSVLVDGPTLTAIFGGNDMDNVTGDLNPLASLFFEIGIRCHTVICCRVSPLQKALVVKLVTSHLPKGVTTLAIGDGANDVPMIQSAQVGVGIQGKEGLQAVLSSDYALAQFRFLQDLLLVHGHYSYRRTTTLILYIFYKSLSYALTQFWFNPFSCWTMQPMYNVYTQMLFSVIFSSVPVILYGILEQDVSREMLLKRPRLYMQGQLHLMFNSQRFAGYVMSGLIHSLVCTIIPLIVIQTPATSNGAGAGLRSAGVTSYTLLVILVNLRLALVTNFMTLYNGIALVASVTVFILFELLLGELADLAPDDIGEMKWIMGNATFYITIIFATVLALFLDYLGLSFLKAFYPDPIDISREHEKGYRPDNFDALDDVGQTYVPVTSTLGKIQRMVSGKKNIDHIKPSDEGTELARIPSSSHPNRPYPSLPGPPAAAAAAAAGGGGGANGNGVGAFSYQAKPHAPPAAPMSAGAAMSSFAYPPLPPSVNGSNSNSARSSHRGGEEGNYQDNGDNYRNLNSAANLNKILNQNEVLNKDNSGNGNGNANGNGNGSSNRDYTLARIHLPPPPPVSSSTDSSPSSQSMLPPIAHPPPPFMSIGGVTGGAGGESLSSLSSSHSSSFVLQTGREEGPMPSSSSTSFLPPIPSASPSKASNYLHGPAPSSSSASSSSSSSSSIMLASGVRPSLGYIAAGVVALPPPPPAAPVGTLPPAPPSSYLRDYDAPTHQTPPRVPSEGSDIMAGAAVGPIPRAAAALSTPLPPPPPSTSFLSPGPVPSHYSIHDYHDAMFTSTHHFDDPFHDSQVC